MDFDIIYFLSGQQQLQGRYQIRLLEGVYEVLSNLSFVFVLECFTENLKWDHTHQFQKKKELILGKILTKLLTFFSKLRKFFRQKAPWIHKPNFAFYYKLG